MADDLDAVASVSKDGRRIMLSIANARQDEGAVARIRVPGGGQQSGKASATVLSGKPEDENDFDGPDRVKPQMGRVEGEGNEWVVVCEPYSLTVVAFDHTG